MSRAQDEVARLVAERGGATGVTDLVLSTPVAGRGPVDGDEVDDRALLRVGVSVLGAVCSLDRTPLPRAPRRRWFARHPVHEIRVGPLDAMVAAHWRDRVERGAGVRWHRLWQGYVARGALPADVDPSDRLGPDAAHEVVAPPAVDPVATDVLRRLNQVLATRPPVVRSRPYDGLLAGRFDRAGAEPIGVPAFALDWAVAQGGALAERVAAGGVPLPGGPASVVPSTDDRPRRVPAAAALHRVLDVLADLPEEGQSWRRG